MRWLVGWVPRVRSAQPFEHTWQLHRYLHHLLALNLHSAVLMARHLLSGREDEAATQARRWRHVSVCVCTGACTPEQALWRNAWLLSSHTQTIHNSLHVLACPSWQ